MYTPKAFSETDETKLHDFIEQNSFATVVTVDNGTAVASHLPLLLSRNDGAHGRLIGHMARANPQWQQASGRQTLSIFTGPHAYISPTWYEVENAVPTWNYSAAHVYGTFRLDDDRDRRREIVRQYVESYEATMDKPWSVDNADADFIDCLLDGIVGFEIDIERFEGKWKLNQNHDRAKRANVVRALREAGGEDRVQIADLMSRILDDTSGE